jgi:hypothetical protein
MSVALTEQAVLERRKTVTRRLGWRFLHLADHVTLCRKVMGRRRPDGTVEPLIRLAEVEVVRLRLEPLNEITDEDVILEGFGEFPVTDAVDFVSFFTTHMRCPPDTEVTRIEWRYLGGQ